MNIKRRVGLRTRGTPRPARGPSSRGRDVQRGRRGGRGRIQQPSFGTRDKSNRTLRGLDVHDLHNDARDVVSFNTHHQSTTPTEQDIDSFQPCTERSLSFVEHAGLETDEDTTIIALNLMDFFLVDENWLPELSYCKLHAASFFMASRITEKENTAEHVADSLGPDSAIVQFIAHALSNGDDESAAAIRDMISVTISNVEEGYALLYERKETFAGLIGQYAACLETLPLPRSSMTSLEEPVVEEEEEDFDTFESDD